jgi:hypothetical protein
LNLNYAIWNQFQITFIYDEQTSIYQGASWTDARAEVRRLLATDFKRYGTISDAFGNCFIVNGSRIKSVTYSENTFQMLITFKDDSTLLVRCVTSEIGQQHFRYLKFLKASNNLSQLMQNRNVKIIAQGATQSDIVFPTFATLNPNLSEGDFVIVTPGSYEMRETFSFKNGVDIWIQGSTIDVNYGSGDTTQYGIFTDGVNPLNPDPSTLPYKRISARIFGDGNVAINNARPDRFTSIMFTYYNSDFCCQFNSWESNNGYPTLLYCINGTITCRIKTITNAEQLLDNDLFSYSMDLDSLNITCAGSFFPGVDISIINPLMIIRNANIISSGYGLESIAQARMTYHLINVTDIGALIYDDDRFSQTGSNFYMHNVKIVSDVMSAGSQSSNWYNNNFKNYTNNLTGTDTWSFYEDLLTIE